MRLARYFRFHRVFNKHFVDVFALRAFERPQISASWRRFNMSQHHPALTLRTARTPDGNKRRLWTNMRLGHLMHPAKRRESQHSQSPITAGSGGVMADPICARPLGMFTFVLNVLKRPHPSKQ